MPHNRQSDLRITQAFTFLEYTTMVGKIIGKYQVIGELAQGRLGPIYRAQLAGQPPDPQREFLLKAVNFSLFTKSLQVQLKARFRREVFAQRQLQHRNVIAVYELLNVGSECFVVTEHLVGATLRDLLMRQGVPNAVEAVSYGRQMLAALDYAHRLSYLDESDFQRTGIVHGDVRLSNLILDQRGRVKLADFSIVHKVIGGELRKLYPELVAYQSPEMQRGSAPDFRSDIFAAGAAFYEMLTGRLPHTAITNEDWRYAKPQAEVEADTLLNIRPDVPHSLATAIARAVRRNPADRYSSISEFLKAVQAIETELGGEAVTRKGTSGSLLEWPAAPERVPTSEFIAAAANAQARATSLAQKQPASVLRVRQPEIAVASYGSALPAGTPLNVEPPVVPRKRERWLLPAFIACALGGTLAGAYFFSSPRSTEGLASNVPASPTVAPATNVAARDNALPAAMVSTAPLPPKLLESPKLVWARQAEQGERYGDALKAYEEYAAANPNTATANNLPSRIAALRQFQSLINNAKEAQTAGRFDQARAQFTEALKLRPTSRAAQTGLQEAGARLATPLAVPLTVPAMAPKTEDKREASDVKATEPKENAAPVKTDEATPDSKETKPKTPASSVPPKATARLALPVKPKSGGASSSAASSKPMVKPMGKPMIKPT
ncbi:MAG: protein kinase, partial [Acidobacteria bacterium]|nr:protein kinase [Acidobacteriota bacterium]